VQKGTGDVGGHYGRHEREVCDMTTGDLTTVYCKGAEARKPVQTQW